MQYKCITLWRLPYWFCLSSAALNGEIHHFVSAASVELPNSIRINVVSPSVVTESIDVYGDYCPAFHSVKATNVTKYYVRSVVGIETDKVFMAYG